MWKVNDIQALLLKTLERVAADAWTPTPGTAAASAAVTSIDVHDMVEDPFLKASTLFKASDIVEKYFLDNCRQHHSPLCSSHKGESAGELASLGSHLKADSGFRSTSANSNSECCDGSSDVSTLPTKRMKCEGH